MKKSLSFLRFLLGRTALATAAAIGLLASTAGAPAPVDAAPALAARPCPPFCGTPTPKVIGRIVFVAEGTGTKQIYRWDAGTTAPVQLTSEPFGASSPVWAPDGSAIAYITREPSLGFGSRVRGGPSVRPDGDVGVAAGTYHTVIRVIDPNGIVLAYYYGPQLDSSTNIEYLTWSNDGTRLCFSMFWSDWSVRGLKCLRIPMVGGAYQWTASMGAPDVQSIIDMGEVADDGEVIAPTESAFAVDDSQLYFSVDTASTRGRLYRKAMTSSGAVGPATRVLDDLGKPIELAFAPSVGMQNGSESLLFNSECWRYDTSCKDEELMRLDVASGAITRLTFTPGNAYGSYGRGAGGAYVLQISTSATGPSNLAANSAADKPMLMPLMYGFAPDWWVK